MLQTGLPSGHRAGAQGGPGSSCTQAQRCTASEMSAPRSVGSPEERGHRGEQASRRTSEQAGGSHILNTCLSHEGIVVEDEASSLLVPGAKLQLHRHHTFSDPSSVEESRGISLPIWRPRGGSRWVVGIGLGVDRLGMQWWW